MAVISTNTNRVASFTAGYASIYNYGTNTSPTLQYTQDGTAITVELDYSTAEIVRIYASADGAPKTSVNSYSLTVNSSQGYGAYTYYQGNTGVWALGFALDSNDNILVPLVGNGTNGTTAGNIYVIKYTKPTEGWRAWAQGTSTSMTTTISAGTSTLNLSGLGTGGATFYGIKSVWYTASGHLVIGGGTNGGSTTNIFCFVVLNASTFAVTSSNGFAGATSTGSGWTSSAQFGRNSQSGLVWWCQGTAATTDLTKAQLWNVTSAGIISSANQGKMFSIVLDSQTNAMQYTGRIATTYYGNNKIVSIARANGASAYTLRVDSISQTSTSISALQSDTAPGSTPSGSYSANSATTSAVYLQPFYEEGFVRIWTVIDASGNFGYLDAYVNTSTNAITFDTASVSVGTLNQSIGALNTQFMSPTWNRYYDYVVPSAASTSSTFNSTIVTLPTGKAFVNPTVGPAGTSFTSPTTSSLNMQGGIRFTVAPTGVVDGHGYAYNGFANVQKLPYGYQLKRVLGAATDYYNATTNTWVGSAVTNTITPTSSWTIDTVASAGAATSGTYTFALALADASAGVTPFGTTFSLVSTTGSSTSTPTAVRFIRRTMPNLTSSHEYTFVNKALVNKINVANYGTSSTTVAIQAGTFYLLAPTVLAAGGTINVDTSQLVDANDRLQLTSSNATTDLWISGTEGI